jgi:hypothetical protein
MVAKATMTGNIVGLPLLAFSERNNLTEWRNNNNKNNNSSISNNNTLHIVVIATMLLDPTKLPLLNPCRHYQMVTTKSSLILNHCRHY